jgi:hypothetical protein
VSTRPSGAVSLEECRYQSGREPQVYDVIEIPLNAAAPQGYEVENHIIDAGLYWTKRSELNWAEVGKLVETPVSLWLNGDATRHGINDRMDQALTRQCVSSVVLIEPEALHLQINTECGFEDIPTRCIRADFWYRGTHYNFMVVDPAAEDVFLRADCDEYRLENVYLCVSLSAAFASGAWCQKLVDAVIRPAEKAELTCS